MRIHPMLYAAVLVAAMGLSGCELIGDVLKIGLWMGVIMVLLIGGIIYWLWRTFFGRRG